MNGSGSRIGPALVVAALALVAALGGVAAASPTANTSATAKKTAKRAVKKAKKAKQTASQALAAAGTAQTAADAAGASADQAQSSAGKAQSSADQAQSTADAAKVTAEETGAKITDITEIKQKTLTLTGGQSQNLFNFGDVTLDAFCSIPNADQTAAIFANTQQGADGQRIVIDGNGTQPDFTATLSFDSVDFLVNANSTGALAGQEVSFALFDGSSAATGIAAVTVDESQNRCEVTAHVVS